MHARILTVLLALACAGPCSVLGGSGWQLEAKVRDRSAGENVVDVVTAILTASATPPTRPGFYVGIKYASLGEILSGH